MIYIHDLNPVALNLFDFKIYWYSLAYFFGFIFSVQYAKYIIKRNKLLFKLSLIDDFFVWAVIGVIIGGRLGYVLFYNFSYYLANIAEIFKIWNGGMSFHGGLLGVVLALYIFSIKKKLNFFKFANIISGCAPIGILFGRLANFVNGELWGKPTNSEWGVIFDKNEMIPRHPSQLYEAFFEGLILFLLLFVFLNNKDLRRFNASCVFLIFYGTFRILIELFREPDSHIGYLYMGLSAGQTFSIPMIIVGLLLLRAKNVTKETT